MKRIFVLDESEVVREALAFNQPRQSAIALEEKTKTAVGEIHGRRAKRQTRFNRKKNGRVRPIRSDKKQLAVHQTIIVLLSFLSLFAHP